MQPKQKDDVNDTKGQDPYKKTGTQEINFRRTSEG